MATDLGGENNMENAGQILDFVLLPNFRRLDCIR